MKWKCRLENIEATDYGSCTKRGRYHFLIFDLKGAMVDQSGKDFKLPSFMGVQIPRSLKDIAIGQGDLQEVLSPEEDEVLIEWLASLRRNEHHEEKKGKKRTLGDDNDRRLSDQEKWRARHLDFFQNAGLEWPPTVDKHLADITAYLGRRMQEIAFVLHTSTPENGASEQAVDINMSIDFSPAAAQDVIPLLACSSRIWLRRRERELRGGEALAAQGSSMERLKAEKPSLTHSQMMELAGNAFNCFSMAAVVIVVMKDAPKCVWEKKPTDNELDDGLLFSDYSSDGNAESDTDGDDMDMEEGSESEAAISNVSAVPDLVL